MNLILPKTGIRYPARQIKLPAPAACIEKSLLSWRHFAPDGQIAMREPSKAGDNAEVDAARADPAFVARGKAEFETALLIGELFGMHERQIEKPFPGIFEFLIETLRHRMNRDFVGFWVRLKSARRPAKHIAGELIEKQKKRQGPFGIIFPIGELAARRSLMRGKPCIADFRVEFGGGVVPAVRPCLVPEGDDVFWFINHAAL